VINKDDMLDWAFGLESPHHSGSIGASLSVTTIRDVLREEITWLWQKRIPQGKLVVIGGDPGLGKSYLTLDIAARVSLGGPWPDGGVSPKGDVLLISADLC
jgi:RecA-family ATPase